MTTTQHEPEQTALFGDPAPTPAPAPTNPTSRAQINDLDLVASVVALALDPGYVLIGPGEKPHRRDPARPGVVDPVPAYERDTVTQLLDAGHLTIGGTHHVTCGRRDGPARSVLVPKTTRAMVERWAALHPLRATPTPDPPPPVHVQVDVVRPGLGLVTCGVGDWAGSITREDGRYLVEVEYGSAVIGRVRSYRAGGELLARHHGHTHAVVTVEHEQEIVW